MPWDQTTHPKIAMPMTAASVAQRRMGLKASIWDNEGVPSALVSNGLWLSKHAGEMSARKCSRTMFAESI